MFYKSKSEMRTETEKQLAVFLARGGSITAIKPRKAPKQKMLGKSSRGSSNGSGGFAVGFPTKSFI